MPWFGLRSFYGHLWHLVASAIATQDIDSRDWMTADTPTSLTARAAATIDPARAAAGAPSLTESLGRDVIIDYIADTGDDAEVSRAMAELLVASYRLPCDGGELVVGRGDVLLFGGDTAYPVATASEIEARLLRPWNEVFATHHDGKKRVLLGIPGNHDWFDGLDGFARMFRARQGPLEEERPITAGAEQPVAHLVSWMEAFAMGKHVVKRRALPLVGYEPVQRASYFALTLAPGLDLWGVDRQLRQVNFQQRRFFWEQRNRAPDHTLLLCLPDPLRAYFVANPPGTQMLQALALNPERDPMLCLAGDVHHYERWHMGPSVHLVAGGGGAFLHGARVRRGKRVPLCEFPGPRASAALLKQVPWRVATGQAGLLPHLTLALFFGPALGVGLAPGHPSTQLISVAAAAVSALVFALLGGWRRPRFFTVLLLAVACGVALGGMPLVVHDTLAWAFHTFGWSSPDRLFAVVSYAGAVFGGAFVFGGYLAALAWLNLNHDQAFAALGHPGYKHFVRMRVRADGSAVDAWVIGRVDPIADSGEVLVDHLTFRCSPREGGDDGPVSYRASSIPS